MSNPSDDSQPIVESESEEQRQRRCRATKRSILIVMIVYAFWLGAASDYFSENDRQLEIVFGLPILIMANLWCYRDAEQRNRRLGPILRIGLVLALAIVFPFYILRTRGLAGILTLVYVGLFVGALVASFIAGGMMIDLLLPAANGPDEAVEIL